MRGEIVMRRAICPIKTLMGILMLDMLCAKMQLRCRYPKLPRLLPFIVKFLPITEI